MKKMKGKLRKWGFDVAADLAATLAVLAFSIACTKTEGEKGEIRLWFAEGGMLSVKSYETEIPDSNSFILEVTGSDGVPVYKGLYGEAPETIEAPSGSCSISVRSREFSTPEFSAPQYGDDQCVIVPSGGVVDVELDCRQLNAGIALDISPDFLTAYPDGWFYVSSDEGRLMYGYSEKRVAYFLPGNISVVLNDNSTGESTVLMTRNLAAKEILVVSIGVSSNVTSSGGGITMQIDTSRTWLDETYIIGGDNEKGGDVSTAMSVAEAKANTGRSGVWVYGYIVGGDLTQSATGISFTAPFSSASCLAIAAKASVTDKASCIAVQLPDNSVREALNLADHPEMLGREVFLKGDITASYYSIVGLKNTKEYELK